MGEVDSVTGLDLVDAGEFGSGWPRRTGHVVFRQRLMARLEAGREAPLVLMVAPAGYGKTVSASMWADHDDRVSAWASLGEADNDPTVLVRRLAAAFGLVVSLPSGVYEALTGPSPPVETVAIPRMLRALRDVEPFVLVLDDVHRLVQRDALRCVEAILAGLPAGSQLVLSGRARPDLPLAKLRVDDRLVEIGSSELAMDPAEAAELLEASGAPFDEAEQLEVVARTEGWPAGLQLAVLAASAPTPAAAKDFSGRDRGVAEYFQEQVTAWLPDEFAEFLLRTSVLRRMSGSLCDFILERTDSGRALEDLVASDNAFVQPLDRERCWYRYHELFRDALRAELDARDSSAAPQLLRRASQWCEQTGDIDAAVRYAFDSDDFERAAGLAFGYVFAMAGQGRNRTVGHWLELFGDERVGASATLSLVSAWHAVGTGDAELLDQRMSALEDGGAFLDVPPDRRTFEAAVAAVRLVTDRGDLSEIGAWADEVRAVGSAGNPWWPVATLKAGIAHAEGGDPSGARPLVVDAERAAVGQPHVAAVSAAWLAILEIDAGMWGRAAVCAARARRLVAEQNLQNYTPMALTYAVMGLVDAHARHRDDALSEFQMARRLFARFDSYAPRELALGLCCAAWTLTLLGEPVAARELVAETEATAARVTEAVMVTEWLSRVRELSTASSDTTARGVLGPEMLTPAELRVIEHLPSHRTLHEIGQVLYISRSTVKTHTLRIYRKLGVTRRGDAVEKGYELGLLER